MSTVQVIDDAGRRVARKEVSSIDRARDEAALLQSLAHPGIVEVLRLEETAAGHGVLVLGAVDGACLDELVLAPRALTAVLAATATTVADLHDRGLWHGALRSDHVLVDAGLAPRLCGFGTAATSLHECQDGASLAADVYDLALLARERVARWRSSEPSPDRDDERAASALDALARRVVVSTPGRRPSARDLAAELARLAAPGRCSPYPVDAGTVGTMPRHRGSRSASPPPASSSA